MALQPGTGLSCRRCIWSKTTLFPDIRIVKPDAALVENRVEACFLLLLVIVEGCEGYAAEEDDGNDIDDSLQAHGDIRKAPCDIQAVAGTDEDHDGCGDAEDRHGSLVLRDKEDICLRIEVIAYDRGKSEETDNDCDKVDANGTNDSGNALLKEGDTRIAAESPVSGQENQEDGRGADQQGVNVDRDDLGQTLLGRV